MPDLSIITINFNNKSGLQKTIDSIINQTFTNYEFIIIDGGSSDGRVDVIKQYADKITFWVSEADKGVYNAMNKGIERAKGEYCFFLNSGDFLVDNNILSRIFEHPINEDFVYGNLLVNESVRRWEKFYPGKLTFDYFIKDNIPHQSTLIKRKLFEIIGLYNENFKIVSDWEFFVLAIFKYNCTYKHHNFIFSEFSFDGISSNPENVDLIQNEKKAILNKYFSGFIDDYAELERLRADFRESHKMRLELQDLKRSIFFKYGFKIGQSIKHFFN